MFMQIFDGTWVRSEDIKFVDVKIIPVGAGIFDKVEWQYAVIIKTVDEEYQSTCFKTVEEAVKAANDLGAKIAIREGQP